MTIPVLLAKRVNNGQSELWIEAESDDRRTMATNSIVYPVRTLCVPEESEVFHKPHLFISVSFTPGCILRGRSVHLIWSNGDLDGGVSSQDLVASGLRECSLFYEDIARFTSQISNTRFVYDIKVI